MDRPILLEVCTAGSVGVDGTLFEHNANWHKKCTSRARRKGPQNKFVEHQNRDYRV